MHVLLTTFNSSFIHKNLALRWLYVAAPPTVSVDFKEYIVGDDIEPIVQMIIKEGYDVVGMSTYIWNVNETKALINALSVSAPHIKIVLGGPEVTYENDDWFSLPISGIVLGEGERVFWDFVIHQDDTYVKIAAHTFKPIRKEEIAYLEQLSSPYALDVDVNNMDRQYLYVEASRGCPFRCTYCLSSLDNHVRFFSLDYLEKVFESVKTFDIKQVKFLDRTFNAHKQRTIALYEMLDHYQNVESFQVEIVADRLDETLINLIIDDRFKDRIRYEIGIQSYNQKTLESVDRSQDNDRLNKVINILLEHKVVLHTDLIAGLPYEDLDSFKASFNALAALYPTELQLGILKLLRGTKMKSLALQLEYTYNKEAPYEVHGSPWLSEAEMDEIMCVAEGVSRSINRNILRYTIKYLAEYVYDYNYFDVYYDFGKIFKILNLKYQRYDLFKEIYTEYKNRVDKQHLQSVLLSDYLNNQKQKPKELFTGENMKDKKRELVESKLFTQEEVYRYSSLYYDYRSDDTLIMSLYNSEQKSNSVYSINLKENVCKKISY
ncbi:MAG: DUF4080 domain-containing protein [Erysipelothrix sp.]|nr:DUF4080 domain-containing protein [Erysipelothrix sp.]